MCPRCGIIFILTLVLIFCEQIYCFLRLVLSARAALYWCLLRHDVLILQDQLCLYLRIEERILKAIPKLYGIPSSSFLGRIKTSPFQRDETERRFIIFVINSTAWCISNIFQRWINIHISRTTNLNSLDISIKMMCRLMRLAEIYLIQILSDLAHLLYASNIHKNTDSYKFRSDNSEVVLLRWFEV